MNFLHRIIRSSGPKGIVLNINRFLQSQNVNCTTPMMTQLMSVENPWIWRKNDNIQIPIGNHIQKIDLPNSISWVPIPLIDPQNEKVIEAPPTLDSDITKHAIRMIVIRRKKMKRHKLKKLRKRLRYFRAKIRQARELKKEKEFQAVLIQRCKEGEAFSAEDYVNSRLSKLKELVTSEDVNGQSIPTFVFNKNKGMVPNK